MTMRKWNVAEAKSNLSQVLDRARSEPQVIQRRGREIAVVISVEDYQRLRVLEGKVAPRERLAEFLRFSQQVRRAGGAIIKPTARRPRRSPFSGERAT